MSRIFQAVADSAVDQNFRTLEQLFPVRQLANDVVGPDQLSADAKDLFLQLVESLFGAKGNVGESSASFPGGTTTSAIKEISHGLDAPPKYVDAITFSSEASTVPIDPRIIEGSLTSSVFKVRLYGPTTISATTINFLWFAIG